MKFNSLIFSLVICISCKSQSSSNRGIDSTVLNMYAAKGFDCEYNQTKDHLLCSRKIEQRKRRYFKEYLLVLQASGDTLISGALGEAGSISWLDNDAIQMFDPPGMIPKELDKEDLIKVYNVVTNEYSTKKVYMREKND